MLATYGQMRFWWYLPCNQNIVNICLIHDVVVFSIIFWHSKNTQKMTFVEMLAPSARTLLSSGVKPEWILQFQVCAKIIARCKHFKARESTSKCMQLTVSANFIRDSILTLSRSFFLEQSAFLIKQSSLHSFHICIELSSVSLLNARQCSKPRVSSV